MRLVPDVRIGAVVSGPVGRALFAGNNALWSGSERLIHTIMVNFPGRNGRRRRVLNEEVLSGSSTRATLRAVSDEYASHEPLRYSEAAGVENHPQITDFVPRRYRTIALLIVAGFASIVALAGLHYVAPRLATAIGVAGMPPFDLASSGSLAAWAAAVVMLASSALCSLIYSIRRHRIDDYRGRYRIWLAASAACLILSANSIAGLHHVLAYTLSHVTGWTALRAGAVWWLAVAGVPLAWITFRTLLDAIECRLAATLWIAAIGCYAAAAACYLGIVPAFGPQIDSMIDVVLTLVGHWLLLAAFVSYARYVVLDAQGLVPERKRTKPTIKVNARKQQKSDATPSPLVAVSYQQRNAVQAQGVESTVANKGWIDGSRPERDPYDDEGDDDSPGGPRKLSKADRKRLRKLKAQNRAA